MSEFVDEEDGDKVRSGIVARYRRGPSGPVEPWEDASFIVYQVTDRYGFMHKTPLPQYERDERVLEIDRERAKKWVKMFANWKAYYSPDRPSEKLRRRVYKGIPDSLRGEAWKKLLDLENVVKAGVYEQFRDIALDHSPDIRQIDLDVNRTYRDHIMFRERFSVKQQALFHILSAYSMYNTDVGYCQGMSGIAALLLMYMNEEDAFWALSQLLTDKRHSMHGLFVPGFPKLLRFQDHHDRILAKLMSKLAKHFEKEGVATSLYTLKWFMQCFLDRLPFSLVLRFYDIFVLEGDRVLPSMAFHILKIYQKQLLKWSIEEIAPFLQEELALQPLLDDEIVESLQETMNTLRRAKLDTPPPPTSSETPSRPPGTLPDRNSYITASKRARMSGDRRNTIVVPMGRPPSPNSASARKLAPSPLVKEEGSKVSEADGRKNERPARRRTPENPPTASEMSALDKHGGSGARNDNSTRPRPEGKPLASVGNPTLGVVNPRSSEGNPPSSARNPRSSEGNPPSSAGNPGLNAEPAVSSAGNSETQPRIPPSYEEGLARAQRSSGRRQKSKDKSSAPGNYVDRVRVVAGADQDRRNDEEIPSSSSTSPRDSLPRLLQKDRPALVDDGREHQQATLPKSPRDAEAKPYVAKRESSHSADGNASELRNDDYPKESDLPRNLAKRGERRHSGASNKIAVNFDSGNQNWSTEVESTRSRSSSNPRYDDNRRGRTPGDSSSSPPRRGVSVTGDEPYPRTDYTKNPTSSTGASPPSSPSYVNGEAGSFEQQSRAGVWKRVPPPYQSRGRVPAPQTSDSSRESTSRRDRAFSFEDENRVIRTYSYADNADESIV